MGKYTGIFFIFSVIFLISLFLGLKNVKAQEYPKIVITEVMYNCEGLDDNREWVEIFNMGNATLELKGWKFNDGSNHNLKIPEGGSSIWIAPQEYLILASDRATFLNEHPNFSGQVIDTVMALNQTSDTISLLDDTGQLIDELTYQSLRGGAGNNRTLEKIEPAEDNLSSNWQESYVLGGTPGEKKSEFILPNYPEEVFELINFKHALVYQGQVSRIVDGDTIEVSGLTGFPSTIRLLGIDAAEVGQALYKPAKDFTQEFLGQTIDLVISQNPNEQLDIYGRTLAVVIYQDSVFNTQMLTRGLASYYETTNEILKNDAWFQIAQRVEEEKIGLWASAGGRTVILSELLPDPVGLDAEGEWIEIYNSLNREVNLSYFLLDNYLIPYGTIIPSKSWLVFSRGQTGITLNNDGDKIQLFFPDGFLVDETNYTKAGKGSSWAYINDLWLWTKTPTAGYGNIISLPQEEIKEEEKETPINTVPIEIKTGDYQDYENKLVKVTGKVTSTSGNTFYLDDGSGEVKIYIQEKTGIDKPEMHKNDIFEVTGIVDLYGKTWRILPQKQDDIKLIEAAAVSSSTSTTKKSTVKKAAASSTSSTAKNTLKTAKAAETSKSETAVKSEEAKSPFWIQLTKAVLGLVAILLIIFIIKIVRTPKLKTIGGHFGDDET